MYQLIWMSKRGQIKKQLESGSSAMLQLWIIQNVTSGYAVILNEDNEIVKVFAVSKAHSMPMPIKIEEFPFEITVQ